MKTILEHPDVVLLQVLLLRTRDAQGFYEPLGFQSLPRPNEMMGRYRDVPSS